MQTKQILKNEKGEELVYINLSYPDFGSRKLKKTANAFYENLAKKFHSFASRRLLPRAIEAKKEGDFKPFSAVMVYNTEETEEKILVTIQAFVFDGTTRTDGNVTRQCWDKKTGLLMAK